MHRCRVVYLGTTVRVLQARTLGLERRSGPSRRVKVQPSNHAATVLDSAEGRFHEGSMKVPWRFHEGSMKVPRGSAENCRGTWPRWTGCATNVEGCRRMSMAPWLHGTCFPCSHWMFLLRLVRSSEMAAETHGANLRFWPYLTLLPFEAVRSCPFLTGSDPGAGVALQGFRFYSMSLWGNGQKHAGPGIWNIQFLTILFMNMHAIWSYTHLFWQLMALNAFGCFWCLRLLKAGFHEPAEFTACGLGPVSLSHN